MKNTRIMRLNIAQGALLAFFVSFLSLTSAGSATSEVFRISIKHDGIRASAGAETLRYSSLWDGGSNATAKVTLKQSDAVLSENLTAEGDYVWSVSQNGTYNLTHTTYTNGAVAKAQNATFVVTGLPDPFPSGSVTATGYNGKFDGNGHGITVTTTDIANPSITYSRTKAGPYTAMNPLFTNVCNETVWYVVAASGYITETNSAMVVISNGDIGGGGGVEPGAGEVPPGGVSKFDAIAMYDGEGHTIDTNALVTAFKGCIVGAFEIKFGRAGSMNPPSGDFIEVALPVWTNVVATSLWYKVTSPNYNDFVHEAKVTITNRAIALASVASIADQEYTGTAIQPVPTVTDQRTLIGGTSPTDIIATDDYTVSYADNVNVGAAKVIITGMNNYAGVVTNTFQIVPAVIPSGPGGAVTVTGYTNAYDGVAHGVVITVTGLKTTPSVQYRSSPTAEWQSASPMYIDVCDTQVWWKVSAPNYSDATGTIGVLIAQAENAWTTEPAITGWTYGDAANTPVGAATFGEIVFTYTPTPVGAAGDYVMTASVAGTANYTGLSSNVAFTVVLRTVVPGGADDPEKADPAKPLPPGAVSKFDFTGVYDGQAHTIDTNALAEVTYQHATPSFSFAQDDGGQGLPALPADATWTAEPPVYTNVGEYVVWYRITAPNYSNYIHEAKVTVTNRPVTLTSGTKLDFVYDGQAHAYTNLSVTVGSFVAGEGIATSNWATVTTVAEGEIPNAFDYAPLEGTLLSNYDLSVVTGKIAVVSPGTVVVTVTGRVSRVTYDGSEKTVTGYDVVSISDPLYTAADFTFTGVAATNGTDAGTYPMGLKPSDFANANGNFASVTFSVTDGALEIAQAENAWTTEPAIAGWTYGDSANTPVGAATFGEVVFSYSPTPVGAAGDYVMTASVVGTANYTGLSSNVAFTVALRTVIPGGADDPERADPAKPLPLGAVSKFDFTGVYDGQAHTVDTNALSHVTYQHATDLTLSYALAKDGAYQTEPFAFRDAVATSFWYRISAPGYADYVHEARVTIEPRDIAMVTIAPISDITYADKPVTPVPVVTDGTPSIITENDYTVSYLNNEKPGSATVTLTGKGNYTGKKSENFTVKAPRPKYAALKGTLAWKLNMGTGCYTAQLKLTCTNGFDLGISDLKFVYQDHMNGTKVASGLWNSSTRTCRSTTTIGGTTYRYVALDASKISGPNVTALYGVQDVSKSIGSVPAAQCTIELYVSNLASPVSDIGYVMWKSSGTQCSLPISAAGGLQGMTVSQAMLKTVRMAASAPMLGAPLSTAALNTSLAMGVVIDPASSPYCKLTDFGVIGNGLSGRVEVGKEVRGVETQGSLGTNARVILMGAKNLSDGFTEIDSVPVDESGAFQFYLGSKAYQFFRVRIDVENVVE